MNWATAKALDMDADRASHQDQDATLQNIRNIDILVCEQWIFAGNQNAKAHLRFQQPGQHQRSSSAPGKSHTIKKTDPGSNHSSTLPTLPPVLEGPRVRGES